MSDGKNTAAFAPLLAALGVDAGPLTVNHLVVCADRRWPHATKIDLTGTMPARLANGWTTSREDDTRTALSSLLRHVGIRLGAATIDSGTASTRRGGTRMTVSLTLIIDHAALQAGADDRRADQ